jgi:hypothetical protein
VPLPPDQESVEKWRNLPQNKPSRDALPPMTGGLGINRALLIGFGIIMAVIIIANRFFGR